MERLTLLPYGLPGAIFRSPMPFSQYYDRDRTLVSAYQAAGVEMVVVLSPWDEASYLTGHDLKAEYESLGLETLYLPMPDFGVPKEGALREALGEVLAAAQAGKVIAIHCHAGIGRTGLFAACLAKVVLGLEGEAAVAWVRQAVPTAVESQAQYRFIEQFEFDPDSARPD